MDYAIAVCTLREDTLSIRNRLQSLGTYCEVVSTPRALRLGCGLSIRFRLNDIVTLRRVVGKVCSFKGYYVYTRQGYERIY